MAVHTDAAMKPCKHLPNWTLADASLWLDNLGIHQVHHSRSVYACNYQEANDIMHASRECMGRDEALS